MTDQDSQRGNRPEEAAGLVGGQAEAQAFDGEARPAADLVAGEEAQDLGLLDHPGRP
jgi:hypothetical protein